MCLALLSTNLKKFSMILLSDNRFVTFTACSLSIALFEPHSVVSSFQIPVTVHCTASLLQSSVSHFQIHNQSPILYKDFCLSYF